MPNPVRLENPIHPISLTVAQDANLTYIALETFLWKGTWSATPTTYRVYDVVYYNGSAYVNKTGINTTTAPSSDTTNWSLMVSKGDQGPSGAVSAGYGIENTGSSSSASLRIDPTMTTTGGVVSTTNKLAVLNNSGNIDVNQITISANSSTWSANNVVTKQYADSIAAGMNWHDACDYATAAVLPNSPNYTDGSADASNGLGVGAYLQATANATLSVDGNSTWTVGQRILVKDQVNAKQNGIYTVSSAGSGSSLWKLIRATDTDNSTAGQVKAGDSVFVISGSVNAGQGFVQTTVGTNVDKTIKINGTTGDNIAFTQFTGIKSLGSQSANTVLAAPDGSTGTPTFRSIATNDLPNAGTSGTYTKVTTDSKGRVTSGTTLSSSDLPSVYIGTTSIPLSRSSASQTLTGISIDGNAATVTNGFYTTSTFNLGTTSISVNRASGSQSLTGISIDGNAGTVTNGVYINAANTFSAAPQTINIDAIGNKGAVIKGASGQTANLQEWQNNVGTALASIGSSGNVTIAPTSTTAVPLTLKGTASLGTALSGLVVTSSNSSTQATLTATGGSLSATGLQPYTTYTISSSGIPSISKDPTVTAGQTGYVSGYTFTTRSVIAVSTTVGTDPGSGGTTITVGSTLGFPYTGTIQIDSEQITYTGLTGTTFTGCTRGANSTTAAPHTAGASVTLAGMPIFLSAATGILNATNATATVTPCTDISDIVDANNNVIAKYDQTGSLVLNNSLIINRNMYAMTWPVVINNESSSFSSTAATYYYTIVPVFSNGDGFIGTSSQSGTASAGSYVRPTQSSINNTNTVTLNWVQTPGAIGYRIYRNTSNAFTASGLLLTTITSGSITTYKDTGTATSGAAPAGASGLNQYAFVTYDYAGVATFSINKAYGNISATSGVNITGSGGSGTLTSPSYSTLTGNSNSTTVGLIAKAYPTQTQDILRISDVNNSVYASFDNFGNLKNNGTNVYVNALSVPSSASAALASGGSLTVSTQYNYQVTAVNPQGETTVSSTVNVTPTSGNQTASLSWAQVPGASSYKIYRATGASPTWTGAQYISVSGTQQTTASSTTTNTYNDTGVTPFSSVSVSGTTVTLNTSVIHGLYNGQTVSFSGFANNAGTNWTTLNSGSYTVTVTGTTQFTITVSSSTPTSTATITNAYFSGTAPTAPTGTKLVAQAWNGQTANLQEWQNSSGTVLASVASGGAFSFPYRAITALRTLDGTDYTVDCTANTFTVTLPTAVGVTGRIYNIKNSGTGVITVKTASGETIDQTVYSTNGYTLGSQYQTLTVQSNGANWIIL